MPFLLSSFLNALITWKLSKMSLPSDVNAVADHKNNRGEDQPDNHIRNGNDKIEFSAKKLVDKMHYDTPKDFLLLATSPILSALYRLRERPSSNPAAQEINKVNMGRSHNKVTIVLFMEYFLFSTTMSNNYYLYIHNIL